MTPALLFIISLVQPTGWDVTDVGLTHKQHCHPGDPTRCVVYLEKGERAPFSGVLSTPTQSAELAIAADPARIQERIDAAVRSAEQVALARIEEQKALRRVDNLAWEEKLAASDKAAKDAIKSAGPNWYETPVVVSSVTVAAMAVAIVLVCSVANCKAVR